MTARDLPLLPAPCRPAGARRLLPALALLAATTVQGAPMGLVADWATHQHTEVAFAFGRGLVAPPRAMPDMAPQRRPPVPAADPSTAQDGDRRAHPYRSACNFTTGCP